MLRQCCAFSTSSAASALDRRCYMLGQMPGGFNFICGERARSPLLYAGPNARGWACTSTFQCDISESSSCCVQLPSKRHCTGLTTCIAPREVHPRTDRRNFGGCFVSHHVRLSYFTWSPLAAIRWAICSNDDILRGLLDRTRRQFDERRGEIPL